MSERNYENLYWEAQSHINELEGDNAQLESENEALREMLFGATGWEESETNERIAHLQDTMDALLADTQEKTS